MAITSHVQSGRIESYDPIWQAIREEAEAVMSAERALGGFVYATILSHDRLEDAICHRLAQRLNHADVDAGLIGQIFADVLASRPEIGHCFRADLAAVYDRDPACHRYIEPLLYFKGFHALVTHRFAHTLWMEGRQDFALYLQSQSSRIFGVDMHPAARIGKGLMFDHATGIVIGETAVIGERVRLYQAVTLGAKRFAAGDDGRLVKGGDRHPILEDDVVVYAGATILGRITIGRGSTIGGNVWLTRSVPPGSQIVQASSQQHPTDPDPDPPKEP